MVNELICQDSLLKFKLDLLYLTNSDEVQVTNKVKVDDLFTNRIGKGGLDVCLQSSS